MTPGTRLRGLFDYAFESHADVVLFEIDEPQAPAVLRAWAAERGVELDERTVDGSQAVSGVVTVVKPTRGRIEVYRRRVTAEVAA